MKQSLGEFLTTLRRANGYTQQEVADKLGVSNRTLSAWERGASMPDILLLPALADLYGVTVDEILRGERAQSPKTQITQKSRQNIYKRKLASFTTLAYVMAGLMCLGLLLFYIGLHVDIITIAWVGWQWWLLLLYVGLIMFLAAAIVLFAVWRGNENAADDDEGAPAYLTGLRNCVSNCAYAVSLISLIIMIVAIVALTHYEVAVFIVFAILAIALFLFAYLVRRSAYKKFGSDAVRVSLAKNLKFFKKCCLFALIPLCLAVVLMITFTYWSPYTYSAFYQNSDAQTFRARLESVVALVPVGDSGETELQSVHFDLSSIAQTVQADGERVELENGFHVSFSNDKSICRLHNTVTNQDFRGNLLTSNDGSLSAYNMCYAVDDSIYYGEGFGGYKILRVDEGYQLVEVFYNDFSDDMYITGTAIIAATACVLLIIFSVCQIKVKEEDKK